MTARLTTEQAAWPEAIATVTACKYEAGAGRALAFGIPTTRHFRIAYNYFVGNIRGAAARMDSFASEFVAKIETLYSA